MRCSVSRIAAAQASHSSRIVCTVGRTLVGDVLQVNLLIVEVLDPRRPQERLGQELLAVADDQLQVLRRVLVDRSQRLLGQVAADPSWSWQ